jgi:hypothetical protein
MAWRKIWVVGTCVVLLIVVISACSVKQLMFAPFDDELTDASVPGDALEPMDASSDPPATDSPAPMIDAPADATTPVDGTAPLPDAPVDAIVTVVDAPTPAVDAPVVVDARTIDGPSGPLGTRENPARSCTELRDVGEPSGVYWARPAIASDPFQVYCDQQLEGGGWAMLVNSVRRTAG